MRIPRYALSEFVPASWSVPQNPITGGMGEFVPGSFVVPENPVMRGMGDFVPGAFVVPQQPAGIGDFAPSMAMYAWPENSVLAQYRAGGISQSGGLGSLGCGGSCGCGGTCGHGGLGALTDDLSNLVKDVTSGNWSNAWLDLKMAAQEEVFNFPVWIWAAGGVAAYYMFGSGPATRRRRR